MKRIWYVFLVALMLGACGQQGSADSVAGNMQEPPELLVSAGSKEVEAVLGAYGWSYDNRSGTTTAIIVDADIPPRIVMNQTTELDTEQGAEINLNFAVSPQEIKVNKWGNSQVEREIDVKGSAFITDKKGYAVYEVIAAWDQGSVHYAVRLHVQ